MEEIKNALFSLNADFAPGLDGFSGPFYQHFWSLIGQEVVNSTQQFFTNNYILPNMNSNLLILVPKVPGADKLELFRPIALANFQFKIITKILADRLGVIASRIVCPQQRGFIPGRQALDCILLAFEAVNLLGHKSFGGNMAIKIYISKAFDTMEWTFLLLVLRRFRCNNCLCNWIHTILKTAMLLVSVNGKSTDYFACSRGVR